MRGGTETNHEAMSSLARVEANFWSPSRPGRHSDCAVVEYSRSRAGKAAGVAGGSATDSPRPYSTSAGCSNSADPQSSSATGTHTTGADPVRELQSLDDLAGFGVYAEMA